MPSMPSPRPPLDEVDEVGLERVDADQVLPGDVLLVCRIPGEPLGEMITSLDGSEYSHSAVALTGGRMASTHQSLLHEGEVDLGGVRIDEMADFWAGSRDIHRLPVADARRRDRAVAFVRRTLERGDGRFSYAKLFLVAGALSALDPDASTGDDAARERLLEAALAAGHAWSSTEEEASYYCAEFVAAAFGATFPLRALAPPSDGRKHFEGLRPLHVLGETAVRHLVAAGAGEAADDVRELRRRTMHAFVAELRQADPSFLSGTVRTLARQARHLAEDMLGERDRPVPPTAHLRRADDEPHDPREPVLPLALVTPRMLWLADWTGEPQVIRRPR